MASCIPYFYPAKQNPKQLRCLKTIELAKKASYSVTLFYLWLSSVELSKERVKSRVLKGGHNIPVDVIERRYGKSMKNLSKFMAIVDDGYLYDNSGGNYNVIGKFVNHQEVIENPEVFTAITKHDK